jgi:mannitol/fructose-specific phosphotransferase system IIA component (Ntr-type)
MGALVHQNAGGFHKIIVVFVRMSEPVAFSTAKERTMAITAKLDMAQHELEMGAQLVDHINEGIQTGMFTPGGTLVL